MAPPVFYKDIGGLKMKLTEYEQEMLDGKHGEGVRFAMDILVKMGDLYGAKRLLPVKDAHIDAAAYQTIWDAGTEFVEYLVDHGAKVAVPTTINSLSRDIRNWKKLGASEEFAMKSRRLEDAYLKMGVSPTWTCAPYECTNAPQFGEVISWSESNAVNYINSVIGAKAERLPDMVDVCCAVVGRVPEYGMYLDENRKGDALFRLEGFDDRWFRDSVDYAILGYYVGEIVVNKVPVIEGLPDRTTKEDLKALSAAAASGGAVCLFHAVGFTPEAPDTDTAFGGREDYPVYVVTPEDLEDMERRLDTAAGDHADMVLMGCPHMSYYMMAETADAIRGRHVAEGTDFWIMTSDTQYNLAVRSGVAEVLEKAGVTITLDTCLMEMDEGDDRWKDLNFVTNSGKVAQYAPGINHVRIKMADLKGCVEAAVSGRLSSAHTRPSAGQEGQR
jgi:predicted aconitase